jgi:hypothetical protein
VLCTAPFTTRCTLPVFFSSTKKSLAPRKAMLIGVIRSVIEVRTSRSGTSISGPDDCARTLRCLRLMKVRLRSSVSSSTNETFFIFPPCRHTLTTRGKRRELSGKTLR